MKIDDLKRAINGVLGENRRRRTEAIINLEKGYARWRKYYWSDDTWQSYLAALSKNRNISIEVDEDVLLIFEKSSAASE